jgi:hypothetical protein
MCHALPAVAVSNNTIALLPMFPLLQVLIAMNISFREHHPPVQLPTQRQLQICSFLLHRADGSHGNSRRPCC